MEWEDRLDYSGQVLDQFVSPDARRLVLEVERNVMEEAMEWPRISGIELVFPDGTSQFIPSADMPGASIRISGLDCDTRIGYRLIGQRTFPRMAARAEGGQLVISNIGERVLGLGNAVVLGLGYARPFSSPLDTSYAPSLDFPGGAQIIVQNSIALTPWRGLFTYDLLLPELIVGNSEYRVRSGDGQASLRGVWVAKFLFGARIGARFSIPSALDFDFGIGGLLGFSKALSPEASDVAPSRLLGGPAIYFRVWTGRSSAIEFDSPMIFGSPLTTKDADGRIEDTEARNYVFINVGYRIAYSL
jgi:hypothetical protein